TMADADLETLDASYITRLESKINEASSTEAYVNDISAVMPGYVGDLAAIELSGKSAPEMAEERIALNKKLISQLADEIDSDAPPVSADRLTEIRRIKALEIREDKEVSVGETTFKPRTTEAVAYAEMLAAAPSEEQTEQSGSSTASKLSPELEKSLRKPYSWDDIVPGYIDMMADDTEDIKDPDDLEHRIVAHKTMLAKLKQDIDLYAVLVAEGKTSDDERIKQRYEQLLSERSMIAQVLSADNAALESMKAAEEESEELATFGEEPIVSDESESAVIEEVAPLAAKPQADYNNIAEETDQFIEDLSERLEQEYANIGNDNTTTATRLSNLAAFNTESAVKISAELDKMMRRMDASVDDAERDVFQLQIQKLDALLADKLQEADRLEEEAESAEFAADIAQDQVKGASDTTGIEPEFDLPESIAFDDLQIAAAGAVRVEDFAFKSLQANMNGSKMEAAADLAAEKRAEAGQLMDDYAAAETPKERSELYARLEDVSREVKRADIELNKNIKAASAAEVSFYKQGAEAIIEDMQAVELSFDERAKLDSIEAAIAGVRLSIDGNRDMRDELDAYDTQAYSAMLKEEMAHITRLQSLNLELNRFSKGVKSRAAAEAGLVAEVFEGDLKEPDSAAVDTSEIPPQETEPDPSITTADDQLESNDPDAPIGEVPSEEGEIADAKIPEEIAQRKSGAETPRTADQGTPEIAQEKESDRTQTAEQSEVAQKELHIPKPGKKYMTPALQKAASQMNAEEKDRITASEPELRLGLEFSEVDTDDERAALLEEILGVDAVNRLRKSPAKLVYLSTAVIADSLKKIEGMNAGLTERSYSLARERETEVERLRGMAARETNKDAKANMEQRAERIAAEAVVSYLTGDERSDKQSEIAQNQVSEPSVIDPGSNSGEPAPSTAPETNPQSGYLLEAVEIIAERTDFSDVTETMFVMADRAVYSSAKPIPVDPEMPPGLIFQVQVGAFRKEIPQDHFGEIVPVMGQKLDNGITRYRAGLFKSYGAATDARDVIRGMGYSDAFVVAYLDGERLTGAQARDILAQARVALAELDEPEVTPATPREATPAQAMSPTNSETAIPEVPDYYNDPEAAEAVQVEAVRGLFYTVQVGVYSKPVALGNLYNLTDLNSELTASGLIRYTTGRFSDVASASAGKGRAIEAGVTDAFVTAYYNGKRISLTEAADVLEREGSDILNISTGTGAAVADQKLSEGGASNGKANFVIILGQFGAEVPQNIADFFLENENLGIRQIAGPAGQSMFVSPEFDDRSRADQFLESARSAGITTAIMGTVIDGEIKALETR
ncbi:MAG: SPOR domain-containing protein, partial [Flavobacteriales bacterium]|nr:SPOR domain-containing protein [Flavobacteriales bacterium]